jgi:predicted cupin superfamily sugar epimerase
LPSGLRGYALDGRADKRTIVPAYRRTSTPTSGGKVIVHARAEELIRALRLRPHREGGHFLEVFRSPRLVWAQAGAEGDRGRDRSALTTIYFLLAAGDVSRWHRLDADEIWHFYEGTTLALYLLDADARILTRSRLGAGAPGEVRVQIVPAGSWLAARPAGEYALAGCTMGPGFDAEGFALMRDAPEVSAAVRQRFPEAADLI